MKVPSYYIMNSGGTYDLYLAIDYSSGDVRSMKLITHNDQKDIIIGINNIRAKCLRPNAQKKAIAN